MENILNMILTGVISLCLLVLSIIMYFVYRRFMKGDFRTICLWTMIILISVAFHEGIMFVHPMIDESIGLAHTQVDTFVDWLLSFSFLFIIVSGVMLIRYFNEFSKRFGLLGRIKTKDEGQQAQKKSS